MSFFVQHKIAKTLFIVTFFSIAMGFMESAVVVYLREIYYPAGFNFPMKIISPTIAITEIIREFATMIMLIGIAMLSGRKPVEKFAFFIFSFAVWDIFYYIFLWLLIGWPESLLTWDVLFLIPFTWVGPVVAPVINAFSMITLALLIIFFVEKKANAKINNLQWLLLIAGSVIVIAAYTEEYLRFMMQYFSFGDLFNGAKSQKVLAQACKFVPVHFKWGVFFVGEIFHLIAITLFYLKNCKYKKAII